MNVMGQNPEDILTSAEINKLLSAAFKKFDDDNSGQLEAPEFVKAWQFLVTSSVFFVSWICIFFF